MNFEVDVFISYAHIDNIPLREGDKGWIANFHQALDVRLSQLIGERPYIWRDKKLQGNDFFGDEILCQFPKTALMVSVLSPRYIKSEWCTREIKEFCKAAANNIGTRVGNRCRIFKVIKTAVPYKDHPREIADNLGYEFFVKDDDTGKIRELHDKCLPNLEQMYWARLDDIAHDMRDLLLQVKEAGPAAVSPPQEPLTVYLAETTSDLEEQRDMIKRELREYGCRILPDSQLPLVETGFIQKVKNYLDQSVLSIHLVGSCFGLVPEGSQKSIIVLQNELAAKKSKTGKLQRLIWLLDDCRKEDKLHRQFINRLRSSADAQYGADLFETSIEDFKSAVHDKLKALETAATAATTPFKTISTVYLADTNLELLGKRESIKRRLKKRGCTVLPDEPLPMTYSLAQAAIANYLEQSDISIHLLGQYYGVVPEETDKSILSIQYEMAAEQSEKGTLERLAWIFPTIDHTDERQKLFIQTTKKNAARQPRTDLIEASFAELEELLLKKLESLDEKRHRAGTAGPLPTAGSEAAAPETGTGSRRIYLICDQGDLADREGHPHPLTQLEDFLFDSGFDVVLPLFAGKEEDVMNDHHENLCTCDAVIIYYGTGSEMWLRSITRDLIKIPGYGRTRPLPGKAVFLAPPASIPKERFRSHELTVINGQTGFSPSLLEPLVNSLK